MPSGLGQHTPFHDAGIVRGREKANWYRSNAWDSRAWRSGWNNYQQGYGKRQNYTAKQWSNWRKFQQQEAEDAKPLLADFLVDLVEAAKSK